MLALFAAVGGVLLIGCANVANLMLVRTSARGREIAVRVALGASTARLARQSLAEAALIGLGGTLAGVAIGQWLCGVLVSLAPPDVPRLADVRMDVALLAFAALAGIASVVSIGLAPALQAARAARKGVVRPEMRAATARGALVRRALIAGEVAVVGTPADRCAAVPADVRSVARRRSRL